MNQEGSGSTSTCAPLEAPFNDGSLTSPPSFPVVRLLGTPPPAGWLISSSLSPRRPSEETRKSRQRELFHSRQFRISQSVEVLACDESAPTEARGHIGLSPCEFVHHCSLDISRPTIIRQLRTYPGARIRFPQLPFFLFFFSNTASALPTLASRPIPNRNRTLPRNPPLHGRQNTPGIAVYTCLSL
ncbi:uncharacterized protein LY79DRAFT_154488 [Colletotrichum navitas]|uniref:Uncharacterized protein n=1 Tax=Colletotrichum navitas TaxID=681940 RepID=A0AAD8V4W2_9PEZI|nr:uncharacterized protein LY79DRAFT_154488 [Colletotrichum navitas]KAK1594362.1 hypothetical protein LY79DRAFT_154488 [Colletotrichum navitas]